MHVDWADARAVEQRTPTGRNLISCKLSGFTFANYIQHYRTFSNMGVRRNLYIFFMLQWYCTVRADDKRPVIKYLWPGQVRKALLVSTLNDSSELKVIVIGRLHQIAY